jgi:hypothetical protein
MGLYHCMTFFPLLAILLGVSFISSLKVKFMHPKHTEHYRKIMYHVTITKRECIFEQNTSVSVHKQGSVDFPWDKHLPRSTANSSVIICIYIFNWNELKGTCHDVIRDNIPVCDGIERGKLTI